MREIDKDNKESDGKEGTLTSAAPPSDGTAEELSTSTATLLTSDETMGSSNSSHKEKEHDSGTEPSVDVEMASEAAASENKNLISDQRKVDSPPKTQAHEIQTQTSESSAGAENIELSENTTIPDTKSDNMEDKVSSSENAGNYCGTSSREPEVASTDTSSKETKKPEPSDISLNEESSLLDKSIGNDSDGQPMEVQFSSSNTVQEDGSASKTEQSSMEISKEKEEKENNDSETKQAMLPPPASTLLLRRSRIDSSGEATYVVASPMPKESQQTDQDHDTDEPMADDDEGTEGDDTNTTKEDSVAAAPPSSTPRLKPMAPFKRRPGRPLGSFGSYKRRKSLEGDTQSGEVRVSSRASTSVFKHDSKGKLISGKPPLSSSHRISSKNICRKDFEPLDPITGKRRYRKRRRFEEDFVDFRGLRDSFMDYDGMSDDSDVEKESGTKEKSHLSDNGVWRPTDDFRLIVNMLAVSSLENVYKGVTFSCFFTYREIEDRWKSLLYDPKTTLVSQNAISALHPDVKAKIYYDSLLSPAEEDLVSKITQPPHNPPTLAALKKLISDNPMVFNRYRTPRRLLQHWQDLREFYLLPGQNPMEYDPRHRFEDIEEFVTLDESIEDDVENDVVVVELEAESRKNKKQIKLLEEANRTWKLITNYMIRDGLRNKNLPLPGLTDFDHKTYAIIRGQYVYYGMTSYEIMLGRSTSEYKVDADLTQEKSSSKISRKQAIIRLNQMGKFHIMNRGHRTIFADGKPVPQKAVARLTDQSLIQMGDIHLVFFINQKLIDRILERGVKDNVFGSFHDLEEESPSSSAKIPANLQPSTSTPTNVVVTSPSITSTTTSTVSVATTSTTVTKSKTSCVNASKLGTENSQESTQEDVEEVPINLPPACYVTVAASTEKDNKKQTLSLSI